MAMAMGWSALQRLPAAALDAKLSRALCGLTIGVSRSITTSAPAAIGLTPALWAEPLKKKKRIDPAVVRAREERKRRKLEKAIRRLEKGSRQLKPLDELELPRPVRQELRERRRPTQSLTSEQADQRFDLMKNWARYKRQQHVADVAMFRRIRDSQERALEELKAESYELYCDAISDDPALVPFEHRGPTLTPPIPGYDSPDGDYIDTTRKWE
ncbi:39S ribosomal protein L40, mitochondrial-like [Pollicipes pollicipes]|uniref:39S ribosomal protein L40, mitochondrial-like n=1 Tax=Pollicipes pollicipes TaxID=41117 RepID=UPI0018856C63|nr:39S ribosomal protein L40, mitochondrial-like [Pollicipes pollicipes]XP_037072443.1 39S ribosomal protein L40, mitochondrial-like [Pollicipes pollicipes]XP_037072444.1 39S ribosomal protein L40, mitochondrial-like [Pollicipes pollicipes]